MAEYYEDYGEDYPDPATLELRLVASSPIEKIKPELKVYRRGCSEQSIPFSTPQQVASTLHELFSGETMIIFIIHGFLNNIKTPWMHTMKDAILWQKEKEKEQVIVVLVGWGKGAGIGTFYYQAAANTEVVGKWLGEVSSRLMELIRPRASQPKPRIWGVGHSLGAHVLGMAGRNSKKSFDRITGLDPAGPLFEKVHQDKRLQKEDARMVDVIHTDGYSKQRVYIGVNHYGTLIPLGTVDFYPNYGYRQPGAKAIAGSHSRATDLFTWSVSNPKKFITNEVLDEAPGFEKPVETTHTVPYNAQMGYFANKRAQRGLFYLETKDRAPWQW